MIYIGLFNPIPLYTKLYPYTFQVGKNDGTVKGYKYFKCPPNHGLLVEFNQVELEMHYKTCQDIIAGFESNSEKVTVEQFCGKLENDDWVVDLLSQDLMQFLK